jgi:hypothetical protein
MKSFSERVLEMPFDQHQRYRLVSDVAGIIKEVSGQKQLRVLDVGGYSPGEDGPWFPLKEFLPDDWIVVVDLEACSLKDYVIASGMGLPFGDKSFDFVVSQDVLEHIPADHRTHFLHECVRVSRSFVLIACPILSELHNQSEQILNTFHTVICGQPIQALEEHMSEGLPPAGFILQDLENAGLKVLSVPSGHLVSWLMMNTLKSFLAGQDGSQPLIKALDKFFNLNFYERDQRAPGYRQVFLAAKPSKAQSSVFSQVEQLLSSYGEAPSAWSEEQAFSMMMRLITLERLNHIVKEKERYIQLIEERTTDLEKQVAEKLRVKENRIQNLEAMTQEQRVREEQREVLIQEQRVREEQQEVHIHNLQEGVRTLNRHLDRIVQVSDKTKVLSMMGRRLGWLGAVQTSGERFPSALIAGFRTLAQSFTADQDGLSSIRLEFENHRRQNTHDIHLLLREGDLTGPIVREVVISAFEIQGSQPGIFAFEPITDSAGHKFVFELMSPRSYRGDAVSVWCTTTATPDGSLQRYENGRPAAGAIIYALNFKDSV